MRHLYRPALVHNTAIGVDLVDLSVRVQLAGHVWGKDAESLPALQYAVEVVMEVMMKPAGRACMLKPASGREGMHEGALLYQPLQHIPRWTVSQWHSRFLSQLVSTFGRCAYPGIDLVWNQVAQNLRDCRKITLKPLHELTNHLWCTKVVNILHLRSRFLL